MNKTLAYVCSSRSIVRVVKSIRLRWVEFAARIGEREKCRNVEKERFEWKDNVEFNRT